ncbi:MAG: TMEM175 family protein [Xenococcaceae cyanobacterium MO_167.B52]|nr:TMEM175 family protein [Xenococcaceae cyanobacterium MO_167.B52]
MKSQSKIERQKKQYDRLSTLVDSIYALVLVILVTNLPFPSEEEWTEGTLVEFLTSQRGDFFPVIIALVLLSSYWIQNNNLFGNLVRTDAIHSSLSLLQILFVFSYLYAVILGTEPKFEDRPGVLALQSLTAACIGITGVISWFYAQQNRRLLSDELTAPEIREMKRNLLGEPITALITFPCAFLGGIAWEIAWFSYPLVIRLLQRFPKL